MSLANGTAAPAPPSVATNASAVHPTSTPGKRKRSQSDDAVPSNDLHQNGLSDGPIAAAVRRPSFFVDLFDVMKRHDGEPSILNHPLSPAYEPSTQSEGKRVKPSEPMAKASIASKVAAGDYSRLADLVADVGQACASVTAALQAKGPSADDDRATDGQMTVARVVAFKEKFSKAALREDAATSASSDDGTTTTSRAKTGVDAVATNGVDQPTDRTTDARDGGGLDVALTLFGAGAAPKQFFSSLPTAELADGKGDSTPALRERALPNGISGTKIMVPVTVDETQKKRMPTLGEAFAPAQGQAALSPPKPSKQTSTRGSSVGWFKSGDSDGNVKSKRRGTYTSQPLTTGKWLSYNVCHTKGEVTSPEARRSLRDPVSMEAKAIGADASMAPTERDPAKEAALFRRAYSAFAPTRDDAAAIVPQEVKSEVWWERVGEKRFKRWLGCDPDRAPMLDPALVDGEQVGGDGSESAAEDDAAAATEAEEISQEAIEAWEPEAPPRSFQLLKPAGDDDAGAGRDVRHVLEEVSDLVDRLGSYQRSRQLGPTSGLPSSEASDAAVALTGSPSRPSTSETDLFHLLRSQLAVLVATLPPHAVAKLDGDRLAELNLGAVVPRQGKQQRGTMEEEEFSNKSRAAVHRAPTGASSRPHGGGGRASYGGPTSSARGAPSSNANHTPRGAGSAAYGATPYGALARPNPGPYGPATPGAYLAPPPYPMNHSGPGASSGAAYAGPNPSAYPPSSQRKSGPASGGSGPYATRSTSPLKGASSGPMEASLAPAGSHSRPYFQTPSATPSLGTPGSAAAPSNLGASGFHTYMTAEQQASMMERQRAQIAANASHRSLAGRVPPTPTPLPQMPSQAAVNGIKLGLNGGAGTEAAVASAKKPATG